MAFNTTLKHFTSSQELASIWATGENYLLNQLVLENDVIYRCAIAHTSGATFATDLGAGKWVAVSAAGASGSKNYIENGDFEDNNTTGWSLFNTTIDSTTKIPTGTIVAGAAGFNALSVSGSSPLAGSYSLSVSTAAGVTITTTGYGFISDAFTIDREDQAKVMGFSFYYEAVSGTMNFSGTSSNTFAVYIRDVSGGAWIQPAGVYNLVQSSGSGICSGTFQTTATGTQYQIAVLMINTVSATVSMRFDDFQLGPQKVLAGAAISDWVSFTPTGSWVANTTYTGRWKRVGDSVQVQASLSLTGAPTATRLTINLPSGLVIDNTKRSGGSGATINNIFGTGKTFDGATAVHNLTVAYESTTAVAVSYESTATAQLNNVTNTTPFAYNSGDVLDIEYTVPISGWSSNTVMSQDTDTRVVAARYGVSGTRTPTTSKAVNYDSKVFDTHGAVTTVSGDVAGWKFTAPVSGFYEVSITSAVTSGATTNSIFIYLNGVQNIALSTVADLNLHSGSGVVEMKSGEYIDIRSDGTPTLNSNSVFNSISIRRLSGPATIAASEKLVCSYNTSTSVIAGSATWSLVTYTNKAIDTHGIYSTSTGVATIPVSGVYRITHQMRSKNALGAGEYHSIHFTKNGTSFSQNLSFSIIAGAAGMLSYTVGPVTWVGTLLAGDLIRFSMDSNSASNGPTTTAAEQVGNMFTIQLI